GSVKILGSSHLHEGCPASSAELRAAARSREQEHAGGACEKASKVHVHSLRCSAPVATGAIPLRFPNVCVPAERGRIVSGREASCSSTSHQRRAASRSIRCASCLPS